MGKNPPKWLPGERIDETILMQRKSVEQLRSDRSLRRNKLEEERERRKNKLMSKRKQKLSTKRFKLAATILKHAQKKMRQAREFHKVGEKFIGLHRNESSTDREKRYLDAKVVLIIRSKGDLVPKEVENTFQRFGLNQIYSARLVLRHEKKDKILHQLIPFSIIGEPTPEQIDLLLRNKGCLYNPETKVSTMISGNRLLEDVLGCYGILCIEDIVDMVTRKGDHLEKILEHIAPFNFHPPRQLFLERHRKSHDKKQKINEFSFAVYLAQQFKSKKTASLDLKKKRIQRKAKVNKRK